MNQREIKFRAWDTAEIPFYNDPANSRMSFYGPKFSMDDNENTLTFHTPAGAHGPAGDANSWQRFILMQYTGLKDKNGKEIYEGDIVEYQYISTKEIGVVEYDPQSTLYGPTVCEVEEGCWSVLAEKETKVIGNVWENPDLLAANK